MTIALPVTEASPRSVNKGCRLCKQLARSLVVGQIREITLYKEPIFAFFSLVSYKLALKKLA